MVDPRETRFKAMSWDEKEIVLEQSAQEALGAREERIASEAVEAPLIAQAQGRDIHLVQDAWERGLFMLEWENRVFYQLQANPDLPEKIGSYDDNPKRIQVDTSGPEFIDVDETVRFDDLEFTMLSAGSLVNVVTRPETVRISVETSTPNPLRKLINIYDDDESPEVSLGTPVHVQEENGPDKTSSHVPGVQT
jgi:hypothetical protein